MLKWRLADKGEQRRLADMCEMLCLATSISVLELAMPGLFAISDRAQALQRS